MVFRQAFERRGRKPRLRERQALRLDLESPMPADRRGFETIGPNSRYQGDEVESVMQREPSQLACSEFRREEVALRDRPGEPSVRRSLTRQIPDLRWGRTVEPSLEAEGDLSLDSVVTNVRLRSTCGQAICPECGSMRSDADLRSGREVSRKRLNHEKISP
jgi:hypothetical protein